MMATTIRWILLLVALALAVASLLTAFKPPVWLDWRLRMIMGVAEGEFDLELGLLPLCIGTTIWFFRRGHPATSTTTIALCAIAVLFKLKPTAQAWRMNRTLPAQLTAAFGPASPSRPPFSFAPIFAHAPKNVAIETMDYTNSLKLDFYRAVGRSPAPCVVAIHGGAWYAGDRTESKAVRQSNQSLARLGYAVASIDYRLAPNAKWPAQRDDVLAAVAFLRANASAMGIDPVRIVLLGRSAGGQLAEATAYAAHDPGIRGVIAVYAPADLSSSWTSTSDCDSFPQRHFLEQFLGGTPTTARDAYESASGAVLAGPGSPPTLILHGCLDTVVPSNQSELLAGKLAAAGVPHALVLLPWATHGFDYANINGPGSQITAYAMEWFLLVATR